jgi:hypothetical protein
MAGYAEGDGDVGEVTKNEERTTVGQWGGFLIRQACDGRLNCTFGAGGLTAQACPLRVKIRPTASIPMLGGMTAQACPLRVKIRPTASISMPGGLKIRPTASISMPGGLEIHPTASIPVIAKRYWQLKTEN